jgi:hypothetical protein
MDLRSGTSSVETAASVVHARASVQRRPSRCHPAGVRRPVKNAFPGRMKTVLVLGPCRSGTSMLAGVLSTLGIHMGEKESLRRFRHLNQYGCYEDDDLVDLVRRIVIATGCHLTWFGFPSPSRVVEQKARFDREIRQLVQSKQQDLWGWKFPWTAAVAPLLHSYLTNPYYIVMRRDPSSTAKSIYARFDDRKNFGRNVLMVLRTTAFWNVKFLLKRLRDFSSGSSSYRDAARLANSLTEYYAMIFNFVRDKPHIVIDYERIVREPEREIERIVGFLGIPVTKWQLREAVDFVNPQLKKF